MKPFRFAFQRPYFLFSLVIVGAEVCIALFAHDGFVRPFVGDALVVALIFALVRMFLAGGADWVVGLGVFLFACLVEVGQYFNLVSLLGLQDFPLARIVIGMTFDWMDIAAYAVGVAGAVFISFLLCKKRT